MGAFGVLLLGVLTLGLSFSALEGWALACPGSDAFCEGQLWTTLVGYLPTWLILGQVVALVAMAFAGGEE